MKLGIIAISATLLLGCGNAFAQQDPSTEKILGAIAGGTLGNTIGDGDGRKAAIVLGAIIGYRNGEVIFGESTKDTYGESYSQRTRRFERYCRDELPNQYAYDDELARSWIRGCKEKLNRAQRQLVRQAYLDGLND